MTITAENYVPGCLDMPKATGTATRGFSGAASVKPIIADKEQYSADIKAVIFGGVAPAVTKAARLER